MSGVNKLWHFLAVTGFTGAKVDATVARQLLENNGNARNLIFTFGLIVPVNPHFMDDRRLDADLSSFEALISGKAAFIQNVFIDISL